MKRIALLALLALPAFGVMRTMPAPRPVSDAERAAVASLSRFLTAGPAAIWDDLAQSSPMRKLGKDAALREIEARLGSREDTQFYLQTVVPSLRDRAAAFLVVFPSGADDSVVFEMVRDGQRYAIRTIRTAGEPVVPIAALPPRKLRGPVQNEEDHLQLDMRIATAAALPAMLLTVLAIGIRRSKRALSIAMSSIAALTVIATAATAGLLALPKRAAKEDPAVLEARVPDFVSIGSLVPVRRAMATGDAAAVRAAIAKLPAGDARDVATLWKMQLDLLDDNVGAIAAETRALRWRTQTPLAHLLRARAAFVEHRVTDTVLAYESAIGTGPGRDALWLEVAGILGVSGFDDRAMSYFQLAAECGSRDPDVYYTLALLAANDEDEVRAQKLFLSAWQMQPIPKERALQMATLWHVFRQPDVTKVLHLQVPEEARFASAVREPLTLDAGATAEVMGDCLLVRAGTSELMVPGGAPFAPATVIVQDAGAWQRRQEEEALAGYETIRARAATSAALADPQLRQRIVDTAETLASRNRWADVLALTEPLSARDERVPIDLMVTRGYALRRGGREADLRNLIVDILHNPAVRRRRDPVALLSIANLLEAIDSWDAAITMVQRARREVDLPGLDQRIEQLLIEKSLTQEYAVVKTAHFDVTYPPRFAKENAEKAGQILEAELARLRKEWFPGFGDLRRTKVNMLWWEDFRQYSGSDYIAGLYTDEILLPLAGFDRFPPEIVVLMTHELTHAILAGATHDLAPRWFHEALASRVEMAEVKRNAFQTYGDQRWLSIALLDAVANNSPDPELIGSAYAIGESTLRFVEAKWGKGGLRRLIQAFAAGQNTEEAVRTATGVSVAELDRLARAWGSAQPPLFTNPPVVRYDGVDPNKKGTVSGGEEW